MIVAGTAIAAISVGVWAELLGCSRGSLQVSEAACNLDRELDRILVLFLSVFLFLFVLVLVLVRRCRSGRSATSTLVHVARHRLAQLDIRHGVFDIHCFSLCVSLSL